MAHVKIYEGNQTSSDTFDKESFKVRSHDDSGMRLADKFGAHVDIEGKNLEYDNGELAGGTITRITIYDKHEGLSLDAKYVNLSSHDFSFYYDRDGSWAFDYVYALGKDRISGSSAGEFITGDNEDDVLLGKGGDDMLLAAFGTDTLSGGGGSDSFELNYRNFDNAVIADFDDVGTVRDSMFVGRSMYKHMSVEQLGNDTVLHFGKHDVTLLDFDAENISKDDFSFGVVFG